jgi:hypothetical protein
MGPLEFRQRVPAIHCGGNYHAHPEMAKSGMFDLL